MKVLTEKTEHGQPTSFIVIDTRGDSAYRHKCGAMVSPRFNGVVVHCPLCKEAL